MRVISMKRLRDFWMKFPDAQKPLRSWYKAAENSSWSNITQVRKTYPHADAVNVKCSRGNVQVTIFNIRGGNYRLVTRIDYRFFHVYVKVVLSHSEYDRKNGRSKYAKNDKSV